MADLRPVPSPVAPAEAPPLIAALTDYGHGPYAALLQAAARFPHAPGAAWIDLDHGVALGDVQAGALTLRRCVSGLPACVCLAVVDPGVGTDRRAVALRTATGHRLVGPDNGLLEPAARRLGGVVALVDLARSPMRAGRDARTFDGRDLFGPVAGALAGGVPLSAVGREADPTSLVALALPAPRRTADGFEARVLEVDAFGTVVLALDDGIGAISPLPELGALGTVHARLGGRAEVRVGATFADVPQGELVLLRDSDGALALARRGGSAAAALHAGPGEMLQLSFDDEGPAVA